jgi:hypothetical protein
MTEFDPGDKLTTPDGTKLWEITGVTVNYSLEIQPAGDTDDDRSAQAASYPEDTLLDKLDRGDLELVDAVEGGGGGESGEGVPCTECNESFESEQGMKSHRSQVHSESESD